MNLKILGVIAIIVMVAIYYFSGESSQPDSTPQTIKNVVVDVDAKTIKSQVNQVPVETSKQTVQAAHEVEVSSQSNIKKLKIEGLQLIKNIRQFIDENNIDELDVVQKVNLAAALQSCGLIPRHDKEALEQQENSAYFSEGGVNNHKDWKASVAICAEVTDEEIFKSYDLHVQAAKTGDFRAINSLVYALPPEALKETMTNEFEQVDYEELRKEHRAILFPLLEESMARGNVTAALNFGLFYQDDIVVEKNTVKALGYYLAAKEIMNTKKFDTMIEMLSENLHQVEIEDSQQSASELVEKWNKLDAIYY